MKNLNHGIKFALYFISYWLIFVIIPLFVAYKLQYSRSILNPSGLIMFYLIFIAPLLFIIPYRKVMKQTKNKLLILFVGFIFPYVVFYLYLYYKIREMGAPHF